MLTIATLRALTSCSSGVQFSKPMASRSCSVARRIVELPLRSQAYTGSSRLLACATRACHLQKEHFDLPSRRSGTLVLRVLCNRARRSPLSTSTSIALKCWRASLRICEARLQKSFGQGPMVGKECPRKLGYPSGHCLVRTSPLVRHEKVRGLQAKSVKRSRSSTAAAQWSLMRRSM